MIESATPAEDIPRELRLREAFPLIGEAIGLLVALLCSTILLDVVVTILTPRASLVRSIAMTVVQALATVLVTWLGYRKSNLAFRDVFPLGRLRLSLAPSMVLMLLGAMILGAMWHHLMALTLPAWAQPKEAVQPFGGHANPWDAFLGAVVLAPVIEESLFRGLILHGLLHNYSRRQAILASAIMFSLFHINPFQLGIAFIVGLVFAWWVTETGSLLPGIAGHLVNNLNIWSFRFLTTSHATELGRGLSPGSWPAQVAVGLAFLGGGAILFSRYSRNR